ncbi:MAG: hypothetical protein GF313_09980 [Caldithrix sp.]|nr:hypothetical protein [Caldithrix sp.]
MDSIGQTMLKGNGLKISNKVALLMKSAGKWGKKSALHYVLMPLKLRSEYYSSIHTKVAVIYRVEKWKDKKRIPGYCDDAGRVVMDFGGRIFL